MIMITGVIFALAMSTLTGCRPADRKLKEDVEKIADVMCRSIEVMNKLKAADPADSVMVTNLQAEEQKIQTEMDVQYREFRERHAKELQEPEFNKKFSRICVIWVSQEMDFNRLICVQHSNQFTTESRFSCADITENNIEATAQPDRYFHLL